MKTNNPFIFPSSQEKRDVFSPSDSYFKWIIILNLFIYAFYIIFKFFMAINLVFGKNLNFFTGHLKFHEQGCPYYTLFRTFIPVILLFGGILLWLKLFSKENKSNLILFFKNIFTWRKSEVRKFIIFLLICFLILSCLPGFLLLVANLSTQYGYMDADSYISLVSLMHRGDYNAQYCPEGGLQFGKYYAVSIPTLILTWILGIGNIVAAYNLVITFIVFFIFLNMVFFFRDLFFRESDSLRDELASMIFIGALLILALGVVVFRNYFDYRAIFVVYSGGLYGALSAIFLYTSILCIISYFARYSMDNYRYSLLLYLVIYFASGLLLQGYFNFTLFLFSGAAFVVALLFAKVDPNLGFVRPFILYSSLLIMNVLGYLAIDIFPRYQMHPVEKLGIMFLALAVIYPLIYIVNKKYKNILFISFNKSRTICILAALLFPYLYYLLLFPESSSSEMLGLNISLGGLRICLLSIFVLTVLLAFLVYRLILYLFRRRGDILFWLSTFVLIISLVVAIIYKPKPSAIFEYPAFYVSERRILDKKNLYAFDENGFKVTYNKYLVDVTRYLVRHNKGSMYYWIVSKTPSNGVYEHGFTQRVLLNSRYEVEGITVKHYESSEVSEIPDWAKINIGNKIIEGYDQFLENITEIEFKTRDTLRRRFKNRYLVLDSNVPEKLLVLIDGNQNFKKVYQNKLYKVYLMQVADKK